jgi:PKD domain
MYTNSIAIGQHFSVSSFCAVKRVTRQFINFVIIMTASVGLSLTAFSQAVNNHKYNVLFIGNSYTYVNNLPLITSNCAASAGDTLINDVNAIGGFTLEMHLQNSTSLSKIATGTWDYVVLQEQSQLPSFSAPEVDTEVFPYARRLDSLIHAENTCGKTMFYMTWGRKNGDTMNCASWPPVCTYSGMDSMLYLRYMMMADSNHGTVSPVGAVRRNIRANYPSIELYQADESHPTEAGTYAAACCFYTAIFKRSPLLITYDFTLPPADAANIRTAVKVVVYDSLGKWHIGQYDPKALFSQSIGLSGNVTFTNTSSNADTYYWSFGDGLTSTATSPLHHYSAPGMFDVVLVAIKCGKSDTVHLPVTIDPSGIMYQHGAAREFTIAPNPAHNIVHVTYPAFLSHDYELRILNSVGQVVYNIATNRNEQ